MRDLFLFSVLAALAVCGFLQPWLMAFAYVYVDLIQPHRLAFSFLTTAPLVISFGVAAFALFLFERHKNLRISGTQILMLLFILWATFTSINAIIPDERVWFRYDTFWKSLLFAAFLPLVLTTRRRIEAVMALVVLCIGLITISAGIKTVLGGGGYDALEMIVPTNKGLYEGSMIATLGIAILPMAIYLYHHSPLVGRTWITKLYLYGLIAGGVLTMIGSEARTGLVVAAAFVGTFWWRTRHKFKVLGAVVGLGILALPFVPQSFVARMETIRNPEQDDSASTRIQVWTWTWNLVKEHPLGTGFHSFRINKFTWQKQRENEYGVPVGRKITVVEQARAWHNTYVEVLGEHGWPGIIIFLGIVGGSILRLVRIRRRYRKADDNEIWIPRMATAILTTLGLFLIGAIFISSASQSIMYYFIALSVALGQYLARRQASAREARDRERFRNRLAGGRAVPAT